MTNFFGQTYRWKTKTWINLTKQVRDMAIEDKISGRNKKWYLSKEHKLKNKMRSRFNLYKHRATGSEYTHKASVLNYRFSLNMVGYY